MIRYFYLEPANFIVYGFLKITGPGKPDPASVHLRDT